MKTLIACLAISTLIASLDHPASAATKVFLLGGQSNMAGVGGYTGYLPGLPADAPCPSPYSSPQPHVFFWNYTPDNIVDLAHNPGTGTGWITTQPGYGYRTDNFGPEVSFGYRLRQLYPNDDIYLVKYGWPSTTLAQDWNPNGSGWAYNTFKTRVNAAMANLRAASKNPVIEGMIWMQGESDALTHSLALSYENNLQNFIGRARSDFAATNMEFVVGRILPCWGTPTDNGFVRAAQDDIPNRVSNVSVINTDDLELAYVGHYGTQGQIDLGTRFANEFAPLPEPSSLALAGVGSLFAAAFVLRRVRGRHKR